MQASDDLPIGALARRTGLAVSAIRYYEDRGLIRAARNAGGQRRFARAEIRRLSFILIAQQFGLTLTEIAALLKALPQGRTPTQTDWNRIANSFRRHIDARIAALESLRGKLDGCIGCGCLSLKKCALYNKADKAASRGAGPRYLLGDRADEIEPHTASGARS